MKKFHSLFILLLLSLVITSCSKKDEKNVNEPENVAPGIPTVSFKGPNNTSNDEGALYTKQYTAMMNSYPLMLGAFASITPANGNGQWKWVISAPQGGTETFTASKNSQGGYTWLLVVNGAFDDKTYNNWKILEGSTSADGKNGNFKIYIENKTTLAAEYNWSTSSNGALSGTMQGYENEVVTGKLEITNNSDNSGSLFFYDKGQLTFKSTWVAAGTGQWWSYEDGVLKTQGTWK